MTDQILMLTIISNLVRLLNSFGGKLVSDVQTIKDNLNAVEEGLDRISADIQALKDQIATGGLVSQADLDALDAQVQRIRTKEESM